MGIAISYGSVSPAQLWPQPLCIEVEGMGEKEIWSRWMGKRMAWKQGESKGEEDLHDRKKWMLKKEKKEK